MLIACEYTISNGGREMMGDNKGWLNLANQTKMNAYG